RSRSISQEPLDDAQSLPYLSSTAASWSEGNSHSLHSEGATYLSGCQITSRLLCDPNPHSQEFWHLDSKSHPARLVHIFLLESEWVVHRHHSLSASFDAYTNLRSI